MSNYLQLCQKLRQECQIPGQGPSSVTNNIPELDQLTKWIADAWTEIQNRNSSWRWMRSDFTLETVAADSVYAASDAVDDVTASAIDRFGRWWLDDGYDAPKVYLQSAGVAAQTWLTWMPWRNFRQIYRIGTVPTGYPAHVSIDPSDNLVLGPTPDDVYVVQGEYQKSAQTLVGDSDEPEMPGQFHNLIVYRAMEKYGMTEAAPEILARARTEGGRMMRQLERNQLPQFRTGGPLA